MCPLILCTPGGLFLPTFPAPFVTESNTFLKIQDHSPHLGISTGVWLSLCPARGPWWETLGTWSASSEPPEDAEPGGAITSCSHPGPPVVGGGHGFPDLLYVIHTLNFLFTDFSGRRRKKHIDLLFHLSMRSLVAAFVCPTKDQTRNLGVLARGSNPLSYLARALIHSL